MCACSSSLRTASYLGDSVDLVSQQDTILTTSVAFVITLPATLLPPLPMDFMDHNQNRKCSGSLSTSKKASPSCIASLACALRVILRQHESQRLLRAQPAGRRGRRHPARCDAVRTRALALANVVHGPACAERFSASWRPCSPQSMVLPPSRFMQSRLSRLRGQFFLRGRDRRHVVPWCGDGVLANPG